jgi:hypothetical protein
MARARLTARHIWINLLGSALLLASAVDAAHAQAGASVPSEQTERSGALAGTLTDLYARTLQGATVIARNEATGAETRATTGKHGTYRFTALSAGQYTLEAESALLGRGRLEGILVEAGHVQQLVTAMSFENIPAGEDATKNAYPSHSASLQPRTLESRTPSVPTPPAKHDERTLPPNLPLAFRRETAPLESTEVTEAVAYQILHPLQSSNQSLPFSAPPLETSFKSQPDQLPSLQVSPSRSGPELPAGTSHPNPSGLQPLPESAHQLEKAETPPAMANGPVAELETRASNPAISQTLAAPGRHWQEFTLDTPTATADRGGQGPFHGTDHEQVALDIGDPSQKLAFQASGVAVSHATAISLKAGATAQDWSGAKEFIRGDTPLLGVQALYGNIAEENSRVPGARMNVAEEFKENGFHGQGFFSDRQNTWGARNPFTQWVKESAPGTSTTVPVFAGIPYTPPDHEIVWGVGAGRQLRRDKIFWFAALDRNQRNDPGLSTVKYPAQFFAQPTNDQMQVLSASLGLPDVNPVVEGLAAYTGMQETLAALLGTSARTSSQWEGFARLDWKTAERHSFALEGTGATVNAPGGGLTRVSGPYGNHSFGSSQANQESLQGRWQAFLTPDLLSVTQISAGRTIQRAPAQSPSIFEQTLLAGNAWEQLPQIVVDPRYGLTIGNPSRFGPGSYPDEKLYDATESLDWVHGNLLARVGAEGSHQADATGLLRNQTGTYSYPSLANFAIDAMSFAKYGASGQLNPFDQHNCDQTGKAWRDAAGTLHGLGYLPCYSYFSQMIGPSNWNLSTNDWAGFATAQWQPRKLVVVSAGLRWEKQQLPPPIEKLSNPSLPFTQKLPDPGNQWGPRLAIAIGDAETHWPLLRLGYGMYFGRMGNATLETALTQTGSLSGDLNYFLRPTDNLNGGGAPPFPNVLNGTPGSVVKPGAVEFTADFKNPEIHQAVVNLEEVLPHHVELTASAQVSLGRRLPMVVDTNFDPAVNPGTITYAVVDPSHLGPIKTATLTVPFYADWPASKSMTGFAGRLNPDYQQVAQIADRANSTYEAFTVTINRQTRSGLSIHARYTYAHAMDWNPNESAQITGSDPLDPANFKAEYGTSNLDVRHSVAATLVYDAPWKLQGLAGRLANGWMVSSVLQAHSGEPYSMRTSGSLAKEFLTNTGTAIVALAPGMNGSGGDNRVYGVGRNTYRYPATWKMDMRLGRQFNLGPMRQLELLAESFNLMNHQNVTELETVGYTIESGSINGALPTLTFLNGAKANTTAFGQPLNVNATNFYRERQIQFGARLRF